MGGGRVTSANKSDSAMLLPVCPPKAPPDASLECPFTLLGETVEDNRTGLIWTRDAGLSPRLQSWDEALDYVKSINSQGYCGSRKWRLPNIRELDSLVDVFRHSPALPMGHPFINVQDAYWSSTTSVFESRYAWVLYFQDGVVGVGFKAGLDFSVWPVRSA